MLGPRCGLRAANASREPIDTLGVERILSAATHTGHALDSGWLSGEHARPVMPDARRRSVC
jgi:hypothetical protein